MLFKIGINSIAGLDQNEQKIGVKIFPNPVRNKLYFDIEKSIMQKFDLCVFNSFGQIVLLKQNAELSEGVDVSFLVSGLYFIKIQNQSSQQTFKVLKE